MQKTEKDYLYFLLDAGLDYDELVKAIRDFLDTRKFDSLSMEYRVYKKDAKDSKDANRKNKH